MSVPASHTSASLSTQACAMLVAGAVVAPSLRSPGVIVIAALSGLYVVLYLAAIFWLLRTVSQRVCRNVVKSVPRDVL